MYIAQFACLLMCTKTMPFFQEKAQYIATSLLLPFLDLLFSAYLTTWQPNHAHLLLPWRKGWDFQGPFAPSFLRGLHGQEE